MCCAEPELVILCRDLLNCLSSSGKNAIGKMAICLNKDGVGNPKCWIFQERIFRFSVHKLLITFPH